MTRSHASPCRSAAPIAALATALTLALSGCSGGDEPEVDPAARVFIVAIDGGTWEVFDPLIEAGRMPNLAKLIEEGSRGVLRSMDPTASSIIWTTVATGKVPDKHGIRGFVAASESGALVPVSSNMRRTKALWNIASEARMTVGFLGWWVTWPAEPVRGFMASDLTWPLRKSERGFATGVHRELNVAHRTYPEELLGELEPFIRTRFNTTPEDLSLLRIAEVPEVGSYAVRDMLLKDISLGEMTGYLLERYHPSLFAVYFDGFDAYCHIFWDIYREYAELARQGEGALAGMPFELRAIAEALEHHLSRLDGYLGTVMEHAGPGDVVLVISDHGYGDNPGSQPIQRTYEEWIRTPHWHTLNGILAAWGGPIRPGFRVTEAGVLDVAPTVLALLGLPLARDMDGRVLAEMIESRFLHQNPIREIATYETEQWSEQSAIESPYDEEVLNRLRALGYLDDGED